MKSIVAVDQKWGIGKNNDLLFHLKADMKHFVQHTKGNVIVMGSNTLLSLPNGMPLKDRVNVVLNPNGVDEDAQTKGYVLAKSLDELFKILHNYNSDSIYVTGGAMMYHTLLPYCDEAIITKVEADGEAQVFYDNLDSLENWELKEVSEDVIDNGYLIHFCTYKNNNPKAY